MNLVPNKEIREAFYRSGLSTVDIAHFCNWVKRNGEPDTTKVGRALGISTQRDRNGQKYLLKRMSEEKALQIIEAMNLDPVDFREIGL